MICYVCKTFVAGRSFRPVDPPGTKDRRWICNACHGIKAETVEDVLFENELEKRMKRMKELYESNTDFKRYVDRHCQQYKVPVEVALEHAVVREYAEYLKEEEK